MLLFFSVQTVTYRDVLAVW